MGFLTGNKGSYETDPYGALNPEQKSLMQILGPRLSSLTSTGTPTYTGDYTSPLTSGEQDAISRNSRLSSLGEQGLSSLLQGKFPEEYYQESIYKPAMKEWTQDVQPLLEEQYAGTGYWGSARAGAVGKGLTNLSDTLASKRAELGWQAQQAIPTAVNAANSLATTETAVQAIPRLIQQYGLDQQYNEWIRTQNYSKDTINQALNFLNISSASTTYKPGTSGQAGNVGSILGLGAGLAASALLPGSQIAFLPALGALGGNAAGSLFNKGGQ